MLKIRILTCFTSNIKIFKNMHYVTWGRTGTQGQGVGSKIPQQKLLFKKGKLLCLKIEKNTLVNFI